MQQQQKITTLSVQSAKQNENKQNNEFSFSVEMKSLLQNPIKCILKNKTNQH